ncbi:Sulfite exporter TauE/SafE family protein 4 [Linum perenne]
MIGSFSNQKLSLKRLEFNWRIVLATVIALLGSACGTVGGVGGGGIFVPMLTLIVGFDTKSAAAISKCMIMGASASSVWYNLQVPHPTKEVPILDYDLALLFQPMLMLGINIGVSLSVVFPYWLITVLIIILFIGTSSRSFYKGILMWKEETLFKEVFCFNLSWKRQLVLFIVWICFLMLQIVKNDLTVCGTAYWALFCLQERMSVGNTECICEAYIAWTPLNITFCALCGILGGTVGGLLGSGGGFILGPLLLEIGVIPQVASATATFVMMFSSSLSVVEFYLLHRFPVPYAAYLMGVSIVAGFWGQYFVRKIVAFLGRASLIVFILSGVIFASALTMGVIGIEKSISMIHNYEFMGFLGFCSSQ